MIARKTYILFSIICSLVLIFPIKAQAQLRISLPDATGVIGETVNIPVTVGEITEEDGITSFQFNVQYDASLAFISGIETDGSLLAGQSVIVNPNFDSGKIRLAYASINNIVGSGVLLYLVVELNDIGVSPLAFDDTRFFDGTGGDVSLDLTDGSLTITEVPPLEPPVLTYPTNGDTGVPINILLNWDDAEGAQRYNLQIATDAGFTSLVVDQTDIGFSQYPPPALDYETQYFWRVNSENDNVTSEWSAVWNFTTEAEQFEPVPGKVELDSPGDASTFPREDGDYWMDFSWNVPTGTITEYQIDIASDESFSNILFSNNMVNSTETSVTDLDWADTYYWRVRAGNNTGWGTYSDTWSFSFLLVGVDEESLISDYQLKQNYPNPFNPTTKISYNVPELSSVKLEIYNLLGQYITTLVNGQQSSGYYEVNWNAGSLSSGIYVYRLEANSLIDGSKQIVLVKNMLLMK